MGGRTFSFMSRKVLAWLNLRSGALPQVSRAASVCRILGSEGGLFLFLVASGVSSVTGSRRRFASILCRVFPRKLLVWLAGVASLAIGGDGRRHKLRAQQAQPELAGLREGTQNRPRRSGIRAWFPGSGANVGQ
jgi:hypothetical protein